MPHPGLNPNESAETPDARHEIRRVSVVVYDGGRVGIEKPDDMMATEAVALFASALAEITAMQFQAMKGAASGTKLVRPVQRVVVPGNGRRRP